MPKKCLRVHEQFSSLPSVGEKQLVPQASSTDTMQVDVLVYMSCLDFADYVNTLGYDYLAHPAASG